MNDVNETDDKSMLPFAVIERMMKMAGTNRISKNAVIEMSKLLECYCIKVTKESIVLANHSGRVTIKDDDIRLAVTLLDE